MVRQELLKPDKVGLESSTSPAPGKMKGACRMENKQQNETSKPVTKLEILRGKITGFEAEAKTMLEGADMAVFAKIEPVGFPSTNITMVNKPKKGWFQSQKNMDNTVRSKLADMLTRWNKLCAGHGLIPVAKIGEFGARIEYALLEDAEKMKKEESDEPKN